MAFGIAAEKHDIKINYKKWGLIGSTKAFPVTMDQLNQIQKNIAGLEVDLRGFELNNASLVTWGDKKRPNAVLLRYQPIALRNNFGGEHITFVFDSETQTLLGMTRMLKDLGNINKISHQQALTIAINFLKKHVPNLVASDVEVPRLNELPNSVIMRFSPILKLGNIELHWIGEHNEQIEVNRNSYVVSGMKVKMYLPVTKLWAWVVVDNNGDIETFERDICWDFLRMQRKTQMWLHDAWLIAQAINFDKVN